MSHKETEEEGSETDFKLAVRLTEEQIKEQKRIEESVKADMAKKEEVVGKEELVDFLGINVVINVYKAKIKPITLKVYREDGTDEVIPNFNTSDLYLSEWRESNVLTRKKRKHADDIHDYFRSTKRNKSSFQYEDHPAETVLNEPCLGMIMFNSHQRQDFVTIEDFGDYTNEIFGLILRGGLFTLPEVRHFVVVCSLRNSLILRDGLFTLPEV
ncbi:hypothetical protein Tco_0984352 [Tanacetum coccineum]